MAKQTMAFEEWFRELKRIALEQYGFTPESLDTFDEKSWRETYDWYDGEQSPADAMAEDMSYA